MKMALYHDEKLIKRIYDLKREHPEWGVRRIGQAVGVSKDTVHRILKRIQKGEIVITESGEVIDASKPKGIVAYQKMAKKAQIDSALETPQMNGLSSGQTGTKNQQDPFDLSGIAKGLEELGDKARKSLEDMQRFIDNLLLSSDFVEGMMDLAYVIQAPFTIQEYSKRGIDASSIGKRFFEIGEKYRRQRDALNQDDSTDVQPR